MSDEAPGRLFDDYTKARQNIYDGVLAAASEFKPVEHAGRRIEITNVGYDPADDEDQDNERYSPTRQANAVRDQATLGRRLRGTIRMVDTQTGKTLEEQRKLLAVIPRMNEDGTWIYRGSRYNVMNQQRLKPSVYGRLKRNEELETMVSPVQGTGSMHRYILHPETGIFYLSSKNSRIPLVPLLRTLGVSDDQIRDAWRDPVRGDEIAEKNFAKRDSGSLDKLYERIVPKRLQQPGATTQYKELMLRQAIPSIKLDPWSTRRVLGVDTDHLTPEVMLKATSKLLGMSQGKALGDDRDHLAFQTVHSVEDLVAERFRLDAGQLQKNMLRKALWRGKLSALPPKFLQQHVESTIFGSGLANQPEYANPLDAWDRSTRVTKLGVGGIGSIDSVPLESRDHHVSHQGFIDPSRTVESLKVGVDVNFAAQARKGSDGKIYTPLINVRTGKLEYLPPEVTSQSNVAYKMHDKEVPGYILTNRAGEEDYVKPNEVDYVMPDTSGSAFSGVANLVSMKLLQPQNRTAMGSRFWTQAIPLTNREAPLVQNAVPGTDRQLSFEDHYGDKVGKLGSPFSGEVVDIKPDRIIINTPQGKRSVGLHANTPLGRKTNLVQKPTVQIGQQINAGDLLATSNYTDPKGTIAMGLNASIALMPWGDNYEDAYTVSESFAKRMASEHSYEFSRPAAPEHRTKVSDFISALPREYDRRQVEQMDPDGVVKVGTVVRNGDPLVLSAKQKSANLSKRISKTGAMSFMNGTQTWEHDDPGVVTNVHRTKRGDVVVSVGAVSPLRDSDKIAETHGSKGIVRILPDDEMLHDQNGKPFDVVSSDLGLISRKNDSRAYAILLGKIAAKTGKPIKLEEAGEEEVAELVDRELAANGLQDRDTVVDPQNGRQIPGVLTGVQYMLKLSHMAESKANGRGVGQYSADQTPAKGSGEGLQAKRLSTQELGALVSHGAFNHLRDSALIRGQRNDEYWARFINGHDLPEPKVPEVYNKWLSYLQGMGVNPVKTGSKTKLFLLSDKDAVERSQGRQVQSGETVDLTRDLKPAIGGLFDPEIFGGDGRQLATYRLSEPLPHPLMEDAFRNLMGVTKQGFRDILSGKQPFGKHGTGPQALQSWLANMDAKKELQLATQQTTDQRKTKREEAIKRMRYLTGIVSRNIDPQSLMVSHVPIIPPVFRPISKLPDSDTPLIDGMNLLYRDMIAADKNHQKVKQFSSDTANERLAVYDSVQAAVGLRAPIDPELERKSVTGIMARLVGSGGPKTSFVNRKLLSGTVDSVGRAVIGPDAKLNMDQVGIPEEQAWSIYKFPVLRNLTRRGIPLSEARELVQRRDKMASSALQEELAHRPIVMSRAPVLHKYGTMAFMPVMVKGTAVHMNPLVYAGYAADNDGDAVNFHVLIGDNEIREAKQKMLPSKSLISPADFKKPAFVPNQDHALGIYLASTARNDDKPVQYFASADEARKAFKQGRIGADTLVKVLG